MKPIISTALALVVAAPAVAQGAYGSQPAQQSPQGPQQASIKPSKKAQNAIVELQTAVNNKDVANIPAKLAAAQAVAETKEDRYLIGTMQLRAAFAANDTAGMGAAVDAIAGSGYLDAAKTADLYSSLGGTLYKAKQFPQAVAAYRKAVSLEPNSIEDQQILAQALISAGQKDEGLAALQRLIQVQSSGGHKADETLYKSAVAAAYEAKSPVAVGLAQQWVTAYPTQSSWSDAIAIYRNLNMGDEEATLDVLRLKQAMGMLNAKDYADLAGAATDQLIFAEAQKVLDAGLTAKMIDPTSASGRDLVSVLKVKAKPTAADLAEATKVAATGKALMRIGDNYAALGEYSNAVAAYKAAMAKPDGDAALANLHIGMALARSGDKAGATAALNSVTGARADIAKYWLTYLAQKA
jgi:tetratricopeptide (TPR) repeat protein